MLDVIKEMGIFIVIAQAVLYFVPGETYVKYVKVIIGIIMIAKMVQPVLSLASEETLEEILLESQIFSEKLASEAVSEEAEIESRLGEEVSYQKIYEGIGEEIKEKLKGAQECGYQVKKAVLSGKEGDVYLTLTVEKTAKAVNIEDTEDAGDETVDVNSLAEYYGKLLDMDADKIQIQTE